LDLVARGITHRYGELTALTEVELEIRSGEVLAMIGPSGCGKSTLLGILGGLLQPSAGTVAITGNPPAGCLNPLTYVFQDFALLPWRTVAGNVEFALEHHDLIATDRRERVDEVLRRTGIADFRAAYPRQLSGGMRQRVGLARALAVRPAVLLLDEPLSALDAQTRELLLEDLAALWAEGQMTSVYVTHHLDEAIRLADRIVVFSRRPGRVKAILPVPVARNRRADPSAAAALAALKSSLWDLIRDEARLAEREVVQAAQDA
jgi:NitT/TauT family transport system ATP-binding protein